MLKLLKKCIIVLAAVQGYLLAFSAQAGNMVITNSSASLVHVACAVEFCVTDQYNATTSVLVRSTNVIHPGGQGEMNFAIMTIPGFGFTMQDTSTNGYSVVAYPFVIEMTELEGGVWQYTGMEVAPGIDGDTGFNGAGAVFFYFGQYVSQYSYESQCESCCCEVFKPEEILKNVFSRFYCMNEKRKPIVLQESNQA
jgi:hypothetical protein